LLLATACSDDGGGVTDPGFGESTMLTISDADPADGNGTLDSAATVLAYYIDHGFEDLDRVTISSYDSTHTVLHELEVQWVPATAEVRMVLHSWAPVGGATSGTTRCAAGTVHACPASAVGVDGASRTITFSDVVLHDFVGGDSTSTVSGFAIWEELSEGGDH
jgi:hypothetical protein